MTKILHVGCSPRGATAESEWLARAILDHLVRCHPDAEIVERAIGDGSVPHVDGDYAISQQAAADVSRTGSMILSNQLIDELENADILVIGTPVHNFTVPSALKAWIDHVVRVRRTFDVGPNGKVPLLSDRPVFVAIASGGSFAGAGGRQPDFLTPYLTAILAMVGLHNPHFFWVPRTAYGPDAVVASRAEAGLELAKHFNAAS